MRLVSSIFLSLLSLALFGCKGEEVQSTWVQSPVIVDGKLEEWENTPLIRFEEEGLALGVKNDLEYLYLAGRIVDASVRRLVERAGIVFWVDPTGDDAKDIELRIPASGIRAAAQARGGFLESMSEEQRLRVVKRLEEMQGGILVIDRRNIESRIFAPADTAGFAGKIFASPVLLSFEVRVPIQMQNYFANLGALGKEGKVGIGIEPGALRSEGFRNLRRPSGGLMGSPGGRGRRGGGGPSSFPGEASGERSLEIWMVVTLAAAT